MAASNPQHFPRLNPTTKTKEALHQLQQLTGYSFSFLIEQAVLKELAAKSKEVQHGTPAAAKAH
jgi:rRNA-processing protein FCF1